MHVNHVHADISDKVILILSDPQLFLFIPSTTLFISAYPGFRSGAFQSRSQLKDGCKFQELSTHKGPAEGGNLLGQG